jgi:pimeloyl-ACP methyl ester carboxylesterase
VTVGVAHFIVVKGDHMNTVGLDGVDVEYEVYGDGEPVLLIHPGVFADWFLPLLRQPALSSYRFVHYHRAGCRGSGSLKGQVTLAQHATHAHLLLQHLGIPRAHVVGHSSSGNVALQLALDSHDAVHSLAILEPALMTVASAPTSRVPVGLALQQYRGGDHASAIDTFLRATCGPDYRTVLDRALPGSFDRAVADAPTFFEQELPALQQWAFGQNEATFITQPTLAVVGARSLASDPIWGERHQLLLDWLPNVEPLVIPETSHLMQVESPAAVAEGLARFLMRHRLVVAV